MDGPLGRLVGRVGIVALGELVAATVDIKEAALSTLNVKHFPMIEGLLPAY